MIIGIRRQRMYLLAKFIALVDDFDGKVLPITGSSDFFFVALENISSELRIVIYGLPNISIFGEG